MEAVNRQSGVHSLINRDHYYPHTAKVSEREQQQQQQPPPPPPPPPHTSGANITISAPINSATVYPNQPPPPYTHTNSAPPSAHPLSGLMSPRQSHPSEQRRASDDTKDPTQSHRQSLPSIHEALYTPNTFSAPRTTADSSSSRPYGSFSQHPTTPTSRSSPNDAAPYQSQINFAQPQRTSPPHPVHISASYPRGDPMASVSYDNHRHPPLPSIRTTLPPQSSAHPGLGPEFQRYEQDPRVAAPVSNGYTHAPPQNGQQSGHPVASNPMPSSSFSPQSPYHPQRPYRSRYEHEDHPKIGENPATQKMYGSVVKRQLDLWDLKTELNNMRNCTDELSRISSALLVEAQRNTNHGSMPERMPSLQDVELMRVQQEKLAIALQRVTERVLAQGQFLGDQHAGVQGGKVSEDYAQEEMHWEDGRNMGGYGGSDAKKRRGRAAPPGRCHSCNRAETPEWRRGPDGARTLCNACGLHYAKLTRKLGSKQAQNASSSLRPSSTGEVSPRS